MKIRVTMLMNIAGRAGSMVIGIIIVPVYLHLLGLQGVGLIGFYTAVFGFAAVIDQMLSTMMIRESARERNSNIGRSSTRDLLRTLELVYAGIGSIIFIGLSVGAPLIVDLFLSQSTISATSLQICVTMMGVAIALQLLLNLQANMLSGLERADLANGLTLLATLLRAVLSIVALLAVDQSVTVYFAAQLVALSAALSLSTVVVWRAIPAGPRPRPRLALLAAGKQYLPALFGNALLFVAITQTDRLIVAHMFSLEVVGRYFIACTIASIMWAPLGPIHLTLMPRFSMLIAENAQHAIHNLVHLASQFLTVAVVPLGIMAIWYSEDILFLWTGQRALAVETANVLRVLCAGSVIWALAGVPTTLQFATGIAHYSLKINLIGLIFIPLGAAATLKIGTLGPALILLATAIVQLILLPNQIFRKLKISGVLRWYICDVGVQTITVVVIGGLLHFVAFDTESRLWLCLKLGAIWGTMTLSALLVSFELRQTLIDSLLTLTRRSR